VTYIIINLKQNIIVLNSYKNFSVIIIVIAIPKNLSQKPKFKYAIFEVYILKSDKFIHIVASQLIVI